MPWRHVLRWPTLSLSNRKDLKYLNSFSKLKTIFRLVTMTPRKPTLLGLNYVWG